VGAQLPLVKIWDTSYTDRKLLELKSRNFTHILLRSSALYGNEFFPLGVVRGAQRPSCKFGTPHISETIRARKLKFNISLDRDNSTFRK